MIRCQNLLGVGSMGAGMIVVIMQDAGVFLTKLVRGVAAFAGLAYFGKFYDKRTTGVLLTFPILNAIGLLSASDPVKAAETIYAIVIWNVILFCGVLTWLARGKESLSSVRKPRSVGRQLVWTTLWLVGAVIITHFLALSPGPGRLFVLSLLLASGYVAILWRAPPKVDASPSSGIGLAAHRNQLTVFFTRDLMRRMILFVAAFCVLYAVTKSPLDSTWTGTFSAFPLPGIFALASLSTSLTGDELRQIRDTVLIGPLLVIPFNVLFAALVLKLPSSPPSFLASGLSCAMVFWLASAALVFWLVPCFAAIADRIKR
jgi:hypothetical protein